MTTLREYALRTGRPASLSPFGLMADAHRQERGGPFADVTFSWNEEKHLERSFADIRVDATDGKLQPVVGVVVWGDSCFVIGAERLLTFRDEGGPPRSIALGRSSADDPGFYSIEVVTVASLLLLIYEGGVLSFGQDGALLWHIRKHWGDVYAGSTGLSLRFENDAGTWRLDAQTGATSRGARGVK